jgi:hypothetical protein
MSDLIERVTQFRALQLPGQPQSMHMGTSYLVNDLVARVRELEADIRAQSQTPYIAAEKVRYDGYMKSARERADKAEAELAKLAEAGAPADEIEITPEMIEAGAKLIADRFEKPLDWWTEDFAKEVYLAMESARPPCVHSFGKS